MSRIAAGYLRRSTSTADNPGNDSREAQEAAIRRISVGSLTLYVDWGLSGSGDGSKRPEYQRLKTDIAAGLVESVAAYSLTRLGRNAKELLGLAELCRAHGVTLRTAQESFDTSTSAGRLMFGMLALMAEWELEQGKERSESARQARIERHRAAGVTKLPGSVAPYGWRNVNENGITRVVRDPDVDLQVIADAYVEAGSVRCTADLLNRRGFRAPKGGPWRVTPLRRVLERLADDGVIVMPERGRGRRHASRTPALFAGLLVCHCGRRLTPNVTRGQYYCAAARDDARHGRMSVTEKALVAVLRPQANVAEGGRAAGVDRSRSVEALPSWPAFGADPAAMNRHLRRIWTRVQLDGDMSPSVVWRESCRRCDPQPHEDDLSLAAGRSAR